MNKRISGSVTVEAALLMAVMIPLMTGLIYLGFYLHDVAWIRNEVRESAVCIALRQDVDTGIASDGCIWIKSLNKNISAENGEVVVNVRGTFCVPGLMAGFWTGNRLPFDCAAVKPITSAKKEIQKWRNLEKIAEGR